MRMYEQERHATVEDSEGQQKDAAATDCAEAGLQEDCELHQEVAEAYRRVRAALEPEERTAEQLAHMQWPYKMTVNKEGGIDFSHAFRTLIL